MGAKYYQGTGKTTFERSLVSTMKMDEKTWLRHANPWSVWTRFSCLPLLCLAIWSREWIGIWAIFPVFSALLWIWANPRVFSPPERLNHWPAKATFGERVWLNRKNIPIPVHQEKAAFITMCFTAFGALVTGYGLFVLDIWATVFGMTVTILSKLWFCDRMVWLYDEMSRKNAVYASWARRPVNDNDARQAA